MGFFQDPLGQTQKLLTGVNPNKQSKKMDEYSKMMEQFVRQQQQQYSQALPQYNQVLDYFAHRAGLGAPAPNMAQQNPATGHYSEPGYTPPTPTKYAGTNDQGQQVFRPRPINNYDPSLHLPPQAQQQQQGAVNPLNWEAADTIRPG
jgi:hypothetical protein